MIHNTIGYTIQENKFKKKKKKNNLQYNSLFDNYAYKYILDFF